MRFIWNEPAPHINADGRKGHLRQRFWERAVKGWLESQGVWLGDSRENCIFEYNDVHHFYDITVFEQECYGKDTQTPIKKFREYLKNSHLDWCESGTWRVEGTSHVDGVRFWIYAEDFPRAGSRLAEKSTKEFEHVGPSSAV
jgi:hypothetical protein